MNVTFDLDDQHHQQIELNSNDPIQCTHLITRREVDIELANRENLLTETTPTNDNNQIFSQPIIDHDWESRYYSGHLVVTCGNFVAYSLKRQNGDDIVCVFYKQVDFRSVINPPFSGDIHDLAFSYSDDVLLACVDQASHLRIYRIEKVDEPNELQHTVILYVDLQYSNSQCPPTLSWCYFIPDSNDSDDSDAYTLLSVTRGSKVEVFNIDIASQSCISENRINLNQIENGRLTYEDNNGNVTCVCFSPDGTALGTGTDKGEIKFFSINFDQPQTCRCLHLWIPHEGRPISSLFFLDDHKNLTQDTQLWRYAISGCDENRELRVWSCTNWSCLQIIRLQYSFTDSLYNNNTSQMPLLKAAIDLTSRFLILSDINRNSLYVFTIYQDAENNRAHFSSINAFNSITSPSLSFAITVADQINREHSDFVSYGVKMYSIHTKFFQEILLVFKTNRFMAINSVYFKQQNNSIEDNIVEDFHFEPYMSYLRNEDLSVSPTNMNRIEPPVNEFTALPPYSINDLLTPNSSLTNVTGLPTVDTTRSLLVSHDGLGTSVNNTTNQLSSPTTVNNKISTIDPLHGLLLGNTTAFDAVTTRQQQQEHHIHISPSQQLQQQGATAISTSPSSRINDRFKSKVATDKDSSSLIINGKI
ncbi:unnamed protein product [Rotaria magnacalcarata]|uniref:Enhancer of mRNA-decapping protein 4 WD40 repeat region domain-containing protein n=1 Tax=Rotaria magnacalcarata TaxID=392030 RepID=A0A8S2LJS4_9BILA|nr:unnamed protein product [Rotaria magnacalcarata]